MRKDIQTINEAYESIRKPFGNATEEVLSEEQKDIFYNFWEKLIDEMPDDVLEFTMIMIKKHNELNKLVKQEHGYRNAHIEDEEKNVKRHSVERNTAEMRAQFTKDKSAANVRRPLVDRSVQGIKRDTLKTQGGI